MNNDINIEDELKEVMKEYQKLKDSNNDKPGIIKEQERKENKEFNSNDPLVYSFGLDYDMINPQKLISNLSSLKGNDKVINVKIFRTKKGYHLKVFLKESINLLRHFSYRALYDDDKNRIIASLKRVLLDKKGYDVLFDVKGTGENLESEYYINKDFSRIWDHIKPNMTDDEINIFLKDHTIMKETTKIFLTIPIYKRELQDTLKKLRNDPDKLLSKFFIQFSFYPNYDYSIIYQFKESESKRAYAVGMSLKEKYHIRTFFISSKRFNYIENI